MTRVCRDCPTELGPKNRSGFCRSCNARLRNADPIFRAKQAAGVRAYAARPEVRAANVAKVRLIALNLTADDREKRREHGRRIARDVLNRPDVRAKVDGPEVRARAGAARTDTVLAWCPPEWRAKYREIKLRGRKASDAKRIVLDLIAGRPAPAKYAQQKAKLAWCPPSRRPEYDRLAKSMGAAEAQRIIQADMTPFERQMAKVAAGARLIEVQPMRRADHGFTIGGVASYG